MGRSIDVSIALGSASAGLALALSVRQRAVSTLFATTSPVGLRRFSLNSQWLLERMRALAVRPVDSVPALPAVPRLLSCKPESSSLALWSATCYVDQLIAMFRR